MIGEWVYKNFWSEYDSVYTFMNDHHMKMFTESNDQPLNL
jgi:hypothetical protein